MKVLYASDGGSPALQALDLWGRAAAPEKAQVTVVSVVGPGADEIAEQERSGPADEIVESAVKQLSEAGFEAEGHLLHGHPAPTLLDEIEKGGFDLTVLGAGNRTWLGRLLFGSVSTKVLHASLASVMIVHRVSEPVSTIRVLFGTDGSNDAEFALDQMIDTLDPSFCQINVLSVAEHLMPHLSFPIPRMASATSGPTPELEKEWIAAAQKPAADAARKLEGSGFQTELHAQIGSPASSLLAEAQRIPADLVVVGTRGLGAMERAAIGSVSDQVVREAAATFVARAR
jgi:nucleotide-binding universal stress UspA family protein